MVSLDDGVDFFEGRSHKEQKQFVVLQRNLELVCFFLNSLFEKKNYGLTVYGSLYVSNIMCVKCILAAYFEKFHYLGNI